MALTSAQYRDIMYRYDQTRMHHQRILDARFEELFQKIPELSQVQDEIISLSVKQARDSVLHPNEDTTQEYRIALAKLLERKAQLLEQNGYDKDYLSPIYQCRDCKDTGYIDNKPCHCLQKEEILSLYRSSNLMDVLSKENFDTFNADYFDDTIVNQNVSLTARQNILRVRDVCNDFIKHFDHAYDNLIFYGPTGVGKTFLTHCIAKQLLDTSHTVLYLTSLQLFDILEKNKFHKEDFESSNEQISYILNCQLLIIDDLGTELSNTFTDSQLFYVIEERHQRQNCTILSTNLSFMEFKNRYSERISSRFMGYYNFFMIFGEDLRSRKKLRSQ